MFSKTGALHYNKHFSMSVLRRGVLSSKRSLLEEKDLVGCVLIRLENYT